VHVTVESPESGWTIVSAIATACAVIAALGIALYGEWRAQRRARVAHEVGLLLQLQERIAEEQMVNLDDPFAARSVRNRIRGLLYALPESYELPAVRWMYLEESYDAAEHREAVVREAYPDHNVEPWTEQWFQQREIGNLIRKLTG